jgi:hypothetical protein
MRGRYDKGFLGNIQEDSNKMYGLDNSVSYLSKNLSKEMNALPNYSVVKENLPSFSISKAKRFESERLEKMPGPGAYDPIDDEEVKRIKAMISTYVYFIVYIDIIQRKKNLNILVYRDQDIIRYRDLQICF